MRLDSFPKETNSTQVMLVSGERAEWGKPTAASSRAGIMTAHLLLQRSFRNYFHSFPVLIFSLWHGGRSHQRRCGHIEVEKKPHTYVWRLEQIISLAEPRLAVTGVDEIGLANRVHTAGQLTWSIVISLTPTCECFSKWGKMTLP